MIRASNGRTRRPSRNRWLRATRAPLALLLAALCAACDSRKPAPDDGRLAVFVSIPPQAYLVQRVGGAHVRVHVLVGAGQSPHTYEPTPRQLAQLSDARAYFTVGLPFERQILSKLAGQTRGLEFVDTVEGIALRGLTEDEVTAGAHDHHGHDCDHDHTHGEHEHTVGEPDTHTWLDPRHARHQAERIRDALRRLDPKHAEAYDANYESLAAELDALHARIAEALAPYEGEEFFVFHPAYGYFADAYGLRQVAVEVGGREPTARELGALIDRARETGARVIFYQPQYSKTAAETIAKAIGGRVAALDPYTSDYIRDVELLAEQLEQALAAARAQRTEHP